MHGFGKTTKTFLAVCGLVCLTLTLNAQSLKLPFFDDFSKPGLTSPDSSLWLPSGVTLNNSNAINPPTQFVATFDGLNARGLPYDFNNKEAYGTTDSLVSRPIDMLGYSAADAVGLSFFWQPQGLGDLPDSEDLLLVKFKAVDNQWVTVWKNDTIIADGSFRHDFIPIADSVFFHGDFQFAFETVGRQSGPFDAWNVDYVYINKGRSVNALFYQDVAVQKISSSLLKHYRSMPMRQFKANWQAEINDKIVFSAFNLRALNDNITPQTFFINRSIKDYNTGNILYNETTLNKELIKGQYNATLPIEIKSLNLDNSLVLSYGVHLLTDEQDNPAFIIDGVDFTRNDSLYLQADLKDYFAYDDGSAELGADVDVKLGGVAVRFVVNIPDTLGAVRINFSPYFTDQSGKDFLLQVYSNKNGRPADLLHQQALTVAYPEKINGLVEYELTQSIAVADTFYIGWLRLSAEPIAVGFDKDSPQFAEQIFYNLGDDWLPNVNPSGVPKIKGSFMLRAVMGFRRNDGNGNGTALGTEDPTDNWLVYPNPAGHEIHWEADGVTEVSVYSAGGVLIFQQKLSNKTLDVSKLAAGSYWLRFQLPNQQSITKKIIVLK